MATAKLTTHIILYLHGFNSSPQSHKAKVMAAWLSANRPQLNFQVPELHFSPAATIAMLEQQYFSSPADFPSAIVGSSLGGYYALNLSAEYGIKAALVNPAVKPFTLLQDYLGDNLNPYTGTRYQLNASHMDELLALQVATAKLTRGQILTLLQAGDQTLDFREAVAHLAGQSMWLMPEGTHEFEDFERVIPSILSHFQL